MESKAAEILVVGAGMSGLEAARTLQAAGHDVQVVDKGHSVGGRLATRRIGEGVADHGAQYFSAQTGEFQTQIDSWEEEGLVYLWAMGFSTGSLTQNEPGGHPRYAVRGGMDRLAQRMAEGLKVDVNVQISSVRTEGSKWIAESVQGNLYDVNAVILTPPVPRSLAILDAGGVNLPPKTRRELERITYAPCIVAMFRYTGDVHIPRPGAVHRPANTIPWIADNQQKGISPNSQLITLHADPDYSRRYWDAPEVEIMETMQGYVEPYLAPNARLVEAQIKRWRYSFPDMQYEKPTLIVEGLPPLAFAGDAFGGPHVEGAYLSGREAARAMLKILPG